MKKIYPRSTTENNMAVSSMPESFHQYYLFTPLKQRESAHSFEQPLLVTSSVGHIPSGHFRMTIE